MDVVAVVPPENAVADITPLDTLYDNELAALTAKLPDVAE